MCIRDSVRRVLICTALTLTIRVAKNNVHGIREHFQRVFVLVVGVLHAPSDGGHGGGSPPIGQRGRPVLVFDETQRMSVAALFPFPQCRVVALLSLPGSLLFFTRRHRGLCVVVCEMADVWYGVETQKSLHIKTLSFTKEEVSLTLSLSLSLRSKELSLIHI